MTLSYRERHLIQSLLCIVYVLVELVEEVKSCCVRHYLIGVYDASESS